MDRKHSISNYVSMHFHGYPDCLFIDVEQSRQPRRAENRPLDQR